MADRIKNYQQEADQITTMKAIRTDLGVTPSSYTPDATVVTKDRVVTYAQAEEELVVLGDVERGVRNLVGDVNKNENDIANIKALLQGHLYDYQTDSTSAYTKSVPAGAMPYAGLEQIGGKTVVWNQLADFAQGKTTTNGVTWTKNSDNSYTANGTADSNGSFIFTSPLFNIPLDHVILVKGCPVGGSANKYFLRDGYYWMATGGDTGNGVIYRNRTNPKVRLQAYVAGDETVNNITFRPLMFDLTQMYGEGNEPSTVAEFESMFPADYYEYNAGELLSAGVTEVVSKDSNNAILQTYSIPAEIQALEGYGWSVSDTVYNEVDFERKVFIKRVDKEVYSRNNVYALSYSYQNVVYFSMYKPTHYSGREEYDKLSVKPILTAHFVSKDEYGGLDNANYVYSVLGSESRDAFWFGFPPGTTLEQAKDYLDGTVIYYELDTPVEIDISAYLTDDNLIQVESGETLTFPNSNGTDYQIPVPSEIEYMIDLQEAINNG